jgi:hypothetical protein
MKIMQDCGKKLGEQYTGIILLPHHLAMDESIVLFEEKIKFFSNSMLLGKKKFWHQLFQIT